MSPDFRVERLSEHPRQAVLEALRGSFDLPFTDAFFEWKHIEGPWGPTDGWVAVDDEGIAGVLCCMPWGLRRGATEHVASRLVDGGTLPRALRRGIFGELVRHEVERCRASEQVIFCTATPAARDSHVKRGATALEPLRHGLAPIPLHRAAARLRIDDAVDRYVVQRETSVETAWTAATLRWRIDPRSGHNYRVASLQHGDSPHGLVYRIEAHRGIRRVFAEVWWGTQRELSALIGAVGFRSAAPLWSSTVGVGSSFPLRPAVERGASHLCVWSFAPGLAPIDALADVRFGLAEVEGLI